MLFRQRMLFENMLRGFRTGIVLFLMLGASPLTLRAQSMVWLMGDVSRDGRINIVDALMISRDSIGIDVPGFFAPAGDVNCDGRQNVVDALLVARYGVGLVKTLCKKTIAWEGNLMLDTDPRRLQLLDIDGDGLTDCLSIPATGGGRVHLNDGRGGFRAEASWSGLTVLGNEPERQRLLCVDGDGRPDWVHLSPAGGGVVYLNDGTGGFFPQAHWRGLAQLGSNPVRQVLRDFNADGCCDWLHLSPAGGGVLYLNDSNGFFTAQPSWSGLMRTGNDPARQLFADVNGDRLPDWVHLPAGGGGEVYLNDGAGGFAPLPCWYGLNITGSDPARQRLADCDGDGYPDWLHVPQTGGGNLYLNDHSGGFSLFSAWSGLPETGNDPSRQRLIDVNGDARPDWIHLSSAGGAVVVLNDSDRIFLSPAWSGLSRLGSDPSRQFLIELDGDGCADWVHLSSTTRLIIYYSNKRGGFYDF